MSNRTRFMDRLFSATSEKDEELTKQVAEDIESAKENGSVEDDEMAYQHTGDGHVIATDKETGENTLIHPSEDGETYDLEAIPDGELERYLHPEIIEGAPAVAPEVCPGCGQDPCACESKEFSVTTNNNAVLKIYSDQELSEAATELAMSSGENVQVGDLSFIKCEDDPDAVVVTDKSSGDTAKVVLDGPDMQVTELDQKNFKEFSNKKEMKVVRRKVYSHAEQYNPVYVVGIDTTNQVLANYPAMTEEAASDLANRLIEMGLEGVQIIANPDEARDYAISLLTGNGVESVEQIGEEEAKEFSDVDGVIYVNRYFTNDRTQFMNKLFSEADEDITATQDIIESALSNGEQVETEDEIITPVSDSTAVVEDKLNGEYTSVVVDGEHMNVEPIEEGQAEIMLKDVDVEEPATEEVEEKSYSLSSAIRSKAGDIMMKEGVQGKAKRAAKWVYDNSEKVAKGAKIAGAATAATGATVGGVIAAKKLKRKEESDTNVVEEEQAPLEQIEDKATQAIEAVQEAAEGAIEAIQEAKDTPVEEKEDIKEANYSKVIEEVSARLFSATNRSEIPSLDELI